jgi:predicted PurR-regulated permease PerM
MEDSAHPVNDVNLQRNLMTTFIQIAAVVILVSYCLDIVGPFVSLIIWGLVLAIAIHPLFLKLAAALGGREKLAATLIIVIGLAIIIVPGWMMTSSIITSITAFAQEVKAGSLQIPPPSEHVANWPLIGERVYETWNAASINLEATVNNFDPSPREASMWLVGKIGSLVTGLLAFAASIIIAGVASLYPKSGYRASCALASRVSPARGQHLVDTSLATIRSVTNGVLGVAVIQAVLAGIGLIFMGVPHGGIITGIVLITSIIQVPALLIIVPLVFWVFSFAAPVPATIFAVYMLFVALSDNVLKPILLGRGVDLPAAIVLIGAIGGMIQYGVIGLFLGAVILGLGYTILTDWTQPGSEEASAAESA